jgi:GNAT superfamily N-acetyltransferase
VGIDIVRVDPLDATQADLFAAWRAVLEASERIEYGDDHSVDTLDQYVASYRHQRYERRAAWAAVADGNVIGHLDVELHLHDNTHRAEFTLAVQPNHRRRGAGTALLEIAERFARDERRPVLGVESDVATGHDDPAVSFAARHGFRAAQQELHSRLTLPVQIESARAEAEKHAEDYEVLTSWDGIPEEWLADRALLARRMSTDAPLGAVDFNEEAWDAKRVAYDFEQIREEGRRVVESMARHVPSGRLVGYTTIVVTERTPEIGEQWATLVRHEHRGHRLGLLVKAANLQALMAEMPAVRRIHTWNAVENEPMLRVNRSLGFAPIGLMTEWQKTSA